MKLDENNFFTVLRANNILLHQDLEKIEFEKIEDKINVQNVATYYGISKLFSLTKLVKFALCYIYRCFSNVYDSHSFSELGFTIVAKILASSELCIDSELEALDAAKCWVIYDYAERSMFAKDLLLKIRLPLLPSDVVNSLWTKNVYFGEIDDCVNILRDVSQKNTMFTTISQILFFQTGSVVKLCLI